MQNSLLPPSTQQPGAREKPVTRFVKALFPAGQLPGALGKPAPALPLFNSHTTALFLDFDGTLVDIAGQPELVLVPPGLTELLARLSNQLQGALAIVSGRTLTDVDAYLAPLRLPVAGEHGAQQRLPSGEIRYVSVPRLHDVIRVVLALAEAHPRLRVEVKSAAVALHYRQAPELESLCLDALAETVKRTRGVELMQGKCVLEVKPAGVSKGSAIEAFMQLAPFRGRTPVFAGDDTTDEAGFAAVQALGGYGIKVGEGPSHAQHRLAQPALLRQWLLSLLDDGVDGEVVAGSLQEQV